MPFVKRIVLVAALLAASAFSAPARSSMLDPQFTETSWAFVASGITSMAWAPDGSNRLFVTLKGAAGSADVRIVKNGATLASPFATLSPVYLNSECGLLGIAFDPDFIQNQYVYFFVTVSASEQQIVRYTASGDVGASKTTIVSGLPTQGQNHDGGGLGFGPDGKLYFSIGDNGNFTGTYNGPPLTDADLVTLAAKVSRVNRDGSVPNDNPFFDGSGPNNDSVWARGFRNPFTLTFEPSTGALWVNSVGTNYEQVFVTRRGDHAGYRYYENNQAPPFITPVIKYRTNGGGVDTRNVVAGTGASRVGNVATFTTTVNHGFRRGEKVFISGVTDASFNAAGGLYVASTPTNTTFSVSQAGPNATSGGGTVSTLLQANAAGTGAAISGGTFYDGTAFPPAYRGNFFYGDYVSGRLMRATLDSSGISSVDYWANNLPSPIDIAGGPDGALYYAMYGGTVYRTTYNSTTQDLIVSSLNVRMAEGGRAAFTVRLRTAPGANVSVDVARNAGDADVSIASGAVLTFTPTNYATPQSVTLAAAQDVDGLDDSATITVSSTGLTSQAIAVRVTDDDVGQLVVSSASVNVNEGGSSTFSVALSSPPLSDLTVSVARSSGDTDVTLSGGTSLTFTAANYDVPQTVSVSAAEDADTANDSAILSLSGPLLSTQTVNVNVFDNDSVAPEIVTAAITTAVVGAPYTYDIHATGLPVVTFTLDASAPSGMTIDAATGLISWTPAAAGSFVVTVWASNGIQPDASQTFTIDVSVDVAPTASITEPAEGATISGAIAEFFGDGFDDVGTVRAEFFVDGTLVYTDVNTIGHYHYAGAHALFDTTQYADGSHTLRMLVYDTAGMSGFDEATVTIANGGAPGGAPDATDDAAADGAAPADATTDAPRDASSTVDSGNSPFGDAGVPVDAAGDGSLPSARPQSASDDEDGCGCKVVPGRQGAPPPALLAMLVAMAGFALRRRYCRRQYRTA